jgi:hypothetical protein
MRTFRFIWLAAIPLLLGADYFQWRDENGVVTFSQLAPHGVAAERISVRTTEPARDTPSVPADPAPATARPELSPAQQAHLERLEEIERMRQQEIARIRHGNCERAEAVLARLQSAQRIRVRDASGQERVMPETEHRERIGEAQRAVAEHCHGLG